MNILTLTVSLSLSLINCERRDKVPQKPNQTRIGSEGSVRGMCLCTPYGSINGDNSNNTKQAAGSENVRQASVVHESYIQF